MRVASALCAAQARGRRRAEVTALARRGNEKLAGCVTRRKVHSDYVGREKQRP